MKKSSAFAVAGATVIGGLAATAAAEEGTLPGGSTISVTIENPADGDTVAYGNVTVSGTAGVGVGEAATPDTDLVFILDTSGSANDDALDAAGSPVECDSDSNTVDSVFDCERYAVMTIVNEATAPRSPIATVGIDYFPGRNGFSSYPLTAPDAASIETHLFPIDPIAPRGGTNFTLGLTRADTLLDTGSSAERLLVFLTDGRTSQFDSPPDMSDTTIKVFTIGGATCTGNNAGVAGQGDPLDSTCTEVNDLSDLDEAIADEIAPTLLGVDVSVNGGSPIPASLTSTGNDGEATFLATATIADGLAVGSNEICATATGTDVGGSETVTDCATVTMAEEGTVIVDCDEADGECSADAEDAGKSTLTFNAPAGFDETVTIVPDSSGDCLGSDCATGYDVLFPTTDGDVRASITVISDNPVAQNDLARAAVLIDGVKITARCNEYGDGTLTLKGEVRQAQGQTEPMPCQNIRQLDDGRLEYSVEFGADPQFRFR